MPTDISWTDETWNPIVGCSHAGYQLPDGSKAAHPGCEHCYAETFTARGLHKAHAATHDTDTSTRKVRPGWNGRVIFQPERLVWPFERWKAKRNGTGRRIFVASLSDLGHPSLAPSHRAAIYGVMLLSPWNTYQNLSKRPDVIARFKREWSPSRCIDAACAASEGVRDWYDEHEGEYLEEFEPEQWEHAHHIHEITSISDQPTADALIPHLLSIPAAVRGVSYEPAIGPVSFLGYGPKGFGQCVCGHGHGFTRCPNYGGVSRACHIQIPEPCGCTQFKRQPGTWLDWIIVGGESGRGARPFDLQWARNVIREGRAAGVPVFVKQMGVKPFCRVGERWSAAGGQIVIAEIKPGSENLRWPLYQGSKGGDWLEWPEDLRVREWPR